MAAPDWTLTDAQRSLVALVHSRLSGHLVCTSVREAPVYRRWEDESLGEPPVAHSLSFTAELRGVPIVARSHYDGALAIELYPYHRSGERADSFDVRMSSDTLGALRAAGFRQWTPFRRELAATEVGAVDAVVQALVKARGEQLRARDLPSGLTLPWLDFVHLVLFADALEGEVVEHGHRCVVARRGHQVLRVQCDPDTNEAKVLAAWPTTRLQPW